MSQQNPIWTVENAVLLLCATLIVLGGACIALWISVKFRSRKGRVVNGLVLKNQMATVAYGTTLLVLGALIWVLFARHEELVRFLKAAYMVAVVLAVSMALSVAIGMRRRPMRSPGRRLVVAIAVPLMVFMAFMTLLSVGSEFVG